MILCNENCIPCCDYCLHSVHKPITINGKIVDGGCIGCSKHNDEIHNQIAVGCGYCEDFYCKNVK